MAILDDIARVYRNFVISGVPASGPNDPDKAEIRALLAQIVLLVQSGDGELSEAIIEDLATIAAGLEQKLGLAGGAMTGDIAMGDNRITNLPAPNAEDQPARVFELNQAAAALDEAKVGKGTTVEGAGLATGGGALDGNLTITVSEASESEADDGTASNVAMTPRRATRHLNARRGASNGVASLGPSGIIPVAQVPSLDALGAASVEALAGEATARGLAVDALDEAKLNRAGDEMSGPLITPELAVGSQALTANTDDRETTADGYSQVFEELMPNGIRRMAALETRVHTTEELNVAEAYMGRQTIGDVVTEPFTDTVSDEDVDDYGNAFAYTREDGSRVMADVEVARFTTGGVTSEPAVSDALEQDIDPYGQVFSETEDDGAKRFARLHVRRLTADSIEAPGVPYADPDPVFVEGTSVKSYWFANDDYVGFIGILGQSNAEAVNPDTGDALIASTPLYPANALMPASGLRVTGARFSGFSPLVEAAATAGRRESLASSCVNHIIAQVQAEVGVTPTIAAYISARTATGIEGLGRGSVYYQRHLQAARDCVDAIRAMGKIPVCLGFVWVQGEADFTRRPEAHAASLRQIARHLDADTRKITSQAEPILMFATQVAAGTVRSVTAANRYESGPPLATLACDGDDLIRMTGPMFQFPISSDNLHLSCAGQNRHGQMVARSILAEHSGIGAVAIKPIRHRWLSSTVLEFECATPGTSLVKDPDAIITPTVASTDGFEALSGGAALAFSVSIPATIDAALPASRIHLTFTAPVTASTRIFHAQRMDSSGNGPVVGGRGVICDTTQHASLYGAAPQRNFLCAFTADVGRP